MRSRVLGILFSSILMVSVCMASSESATGQVASTSDTVVAEISDDVEILPAAGFFSRQPSIAEYDALFAIFEREAKTVTYAEATESEDEVEEETEATEDASDGVSADYLALAIESEAGNVESFNGRVAVGLTALKRIDSPIYPGTLPEVIEQPYQYATLVDYYSEKSYDAAVHAIDLWEGDNDESVLPDGYMYFFGYNRENWFYCKTASGEYEIYALPGQTVTDDVWKAFRRIVLKEDTSDTSSDIVEEPALDLETIEQAANVATDVNEGAEGTETAGEIMEATDVAETALTDTDSGAVLETPTTEESLEVEALVETENSSL